MQAETFEKQKGHIILMGLDATSRRLSQLMEGRSISGHERYQLHFSLPSFFSFHSPNRSC